HPRMAEDLGYAKGYQYSHSFPGGISPDQDYLGVEKTYYAPTDRGYEKYIRQYLEWAEKMREKTRNPSETSPPPPEKTP
ncbi:MAG TPA: hypothetical protein PKZ08_15155, partial [Vicinamibacterales bacterium]|nr:hypothetical protein [Vicinamibacterales bacterium]